MSERRKNGGIRDLSNDELAGFVRLLLGGKQLPKETPDVIDYLESVSRRVSQPDPPGSPSRPGRVKNVAERLREARPRPIRAFGTHLLATRIGAGCQIEEVSQFLGERPSLLRDIERRDLSPLDLEIGTLARITVMFGFTPGELRDSLVLELCDGPQAGSAGNPFARSSEKDFRAELIHLASEDLLRTVESRAPDSLAKKEALARIEVIVQGVTELLKS